MEQFKSLILKHNLTLPPIINVYAYGSVNYDTFIEGKSDYDYIVIFDTNESIVDIKLDDFNINGMSETVFLQKLAEADISILEALQKPLLETKHIDMNFDNFALRNHVSGKADNSYVKAKKKLLVEHEPYIAKKSLFHSLRMLFYAIELAEHKKIINWSMKELYDEIMSLPEIDESGKITDSVWQIWNDKYKKMFNALKTEFRKHAPKPST